MNPAPEENTAPALGTDPTRLFYLLMLDLLEPRTVAAFWADRGIRTSAGTVRGAALLDHLLGVHDDIHIDDVSGLIDDIECLLDEHGLGDEHFLDDALAKAAGRGELVSPRMAAYILGSIAESLLAADDGREAILDALPQINARMRLGHSLNALTTERGKTRTDTWVCVAPMQSGCPPQWRINGELFIGRILKHLPSAFGLPSFDQCVIRANCQDFRKRLPPTIEWKREANVLYVEGEKYGRFLPFSAWLAEHGQRLPPDLNAPDRTVCLAERDLHSAHGARVILREGCVYQSPYYLFVVTLLERTARRARIEELTTRVLHDSDGQQRLRHVHEEVLRCLRERHNHFVYARKRRKLYHAGRVLFSKTQAALMARLLGSPNRALQLKDLMADPDIFPDTRGNPSLSLRLRRIEEKLVRCCPCMRLERGGGNGEVTLVAETVPELTYVDGKQPL